MQERKDRGQINIEGVEIILDPSGGTIFTRTLIFERDDLLEQCPPELQEVIKLMHHGETLRARSQHEGGRKFIEMAHNILLSSARTDHGDINDF